MQYTINEYSDQLDNAYWDGYRDGASAAPFWNRCYGLLLAAMMFALGVWIGYLI